MEELQLAARMAEESCRYLLWQQSLSSGRTRQAARRAKAGGQHLKQIQSDIEAYWPKRNKGMPTHCAAFLDWRMNDYRAKRLHYTPAEAQLPPTPRVDT